MARSNIIASSEDLQGDDGGVLFSLIQGEQLEFPVTLEFIANASQAYVYECVIMEGDNVLDQTSPPVKARAGGIANQLVVWVPVDKGNWSASTPYSMDELVKYGDLFYLKLSGTDETTSTIPSVDSTWLEYSPNVAYIRLSSGLSMDWAVQPTTESKVYGFIELSVTEPPGGRYRRTWKPLRGVIQFLYSPTQVIN
jgi:hypothetical protein